MNRVSLKGTQFFSKDKMTNPTEFFDSRPLPNTSPASISEVAERTLALEQKRKRECRSNKRLDERANRQARKQMKQQVEALEAVEEEKEEDEFESIKTENLKSSFVQAIQDSTLTDEEAAIGAEASMIPEGVSALLESMPGEKMTFTRLFPNLKSYLEAMYDYTITKNKGMTNLIVSEVDQLFGPRNTRQQWVNVGWSEQGAPEGLSKQGSQPSKIGKDFGSNEQLADALKLNVASFCNGNQNAASIVKLQTNEMLKRKLITIKERQTVFKNFGLT